MERGQDGGGQRRDEDDQDEPGESRAGASGLRDDGSVRMFDPELFNVMWSAVRPGVLAPYVRGNIEAERAGAEVRAVYALLKNHGPLDRLQMMTDIDGRPYLILYMGADLALEAVAAIRAGLAVVDDVAGDGG